MSDQQYAPPPATPYGTPSYQDRTNPLAIVALIAAFVIPLAGIICGHIALAQIKRSGERGHGLALAGTILGYVFVGLGILMFFLFFALAAAQGVNSYSG
jgi:peptidyl-prolyl cis-trans isomerase B (cyclophilin B)